MKNKKSKAIIFTDIMINRVEEIKLKHGFPTFTSVLHYAITETYKNEFKDYVVSKKRNKMIEKEEPEVDDKKGEVICSLLEGEISENAGLQYCTYYKYNRKNRYKQVTFIQDLTENIIDTQYTPSKKEVLSLRENGNTNY